ncbi:N-acetylserotonin O-methyltransferase-like protein [Acipenser ruthenus]|uniref:N-acetylserotonin O-methyltransferase-like protein n=1 Tax=Acipenser ruthenus TaxID=7906 RepID=A0A662YV42_ACIRT|nr:N-acetylserotonin O-methyltransferase-like protein [Acipenser ruthenus]
MALNATRLDNVTLGMFTDNTASYTLSAVYIIVFCINLPGNGFSLWLLLFHTKPKTPSIIFMINLTITDLALCMFLPLQIAYLINSYDWTFGETLCSLVSVMFYSNMYCSILTMTAISVERYFGVVHPMRFDCKRTRYALAACLAMWGIVLLIFYPLVSTDLTYRVKELNITTCFDVLKKDMLPSMGAWAAFLFTLFGILFLIPFLLTMFCYTGIILKLLKTSRAIKMVLNPVITKLAGRLVVLASASPRRREILTNVGLRFEVVPSWFKETLDKSSFAAPHLYAVETAKQKALEVARRMQIKHLKTPDIVIGADTIVTIEGDILEKPADKQDAYRMLSRLSGKEHSVFTGVAIVHCTSETDSQMEYDVFDFYEETKVKFADLSEELLWEYIHSGEPMDKAGGYGIQALGGMLVEYVHGDFLNVVGFPLNHFCKKLAEIYNPPPKSEIRHTKYESIPNVETFDNPGDLESGLERHTENREAIRIGNQPGDQDNRSISHHCAAVSVEAQGSAKGPVEFPHNIADLLDGFKASKTLFVASKLKVFDLLNHHGSLEVGEVADKLQTSVVGTERLLEGCVALGLLEKTHQLDSQVYKNTEQANMYLVSSSDYSLHGYIIHCNDHVWPLFTHLEHAVQEGTNQNERAFGSKTEDLFQGLRFEVVPSWFKETLDKSSFAAPHLYAVETAKQKALEVARRMQIKHLKTPDIVIGADTIVTIEGDILEKPADKQDAYRMLSRLSGKEHSVFTGVAIVHCTSETDSQMEYDVFDFYEETKVKFADLSEELLWEYIHSGEPMDKAGGYGIQALGGMLVEYVHGDFLNVVGFPLNHFCKKLAEIYNPPPKSEIRHTKYESIPNVETFDNPGDLESGLERHTENGEAIRIGNQPGDQDNRSISHHCAAVSVEAQGSAKGPVEFPHNIADLLDGFKASKTLFVASKLKVFDLLNHHGSLEVGEVADKLQTSVVGTERLLEGCVALGLLEKTHQLDSQDVRLRFMNAMHSIARATGRDVAAVFDFSLFKTACDVGGCTGAMAYELVKMYPDLTIAVYDLPAVIEMSSHFRPHKQDTHRVTFTAGDFFKDDLPKADLYILSRILHDWSEDKIDVLLSKISQICTPGCGLLVAEIVLDEQRRSPARALLQALSMTEGKQRSGSEYSQLLQKYAFTEIQPKHTGNFLDAILFVKQ